MTALSPLERKALKARAHHLDPVVLIGDAGLTPAVLHEIDLALNSHELIKVRMAGDDRAARTAACESICAALVCAPVQHIGKLMVLYRPQPADPAATGAAAKRRRPAGPRKTKKQLAQLENRPPAKRTARGAPKQAAPRVVQGTVARGGMRTVGRARAQPARPAGRAPARSPARPVKRT